VKGDQTTDPYSSCDLTRAQFRVLSVKTSLNSLQFLFIKPSTLFALLEILSIWEFQDSLWFVRKPRSENSAVTSRVVPPNCRGAKIGERLFVIRTILHFFVLKLIWFSRLQETKLFRSSWSDSWSHGCWMTLEVLQSSAYKATKLVGETTSGRSLTSGRSFTNEIADCMCHNGAWNYNSKTNNTTRLEARNKQRKLLTSDLCSGRKKAKEKLLISPNDTPCKLRTTPSMRLLKT